MPIVIIVVVVFIVIILGCLAYYWAFPKKQQEHFENNTISVIDAAKNAQQSFTVEKCEALRPKRGLSDGRAEATVVDFIDGMRLNKFKPHNIGVDGNNGKDYCFVFDDPKHDYQDRLIYGQSCSKDNIMFKDAKFITNVYKDDKPTDVYSFDVSKCVLEIDPAKVNDDELQKFWSNVSKNECTIMTQDLRDSLANCKAEIVRMGDSFESAKKRLLEVKQGYDTECNVQRNRYNNYEMQIEAEEEKLNQCSKNLSDLNMQLGHYNEMLHGFEGYNAKLQQGYMSFSNVYGGSPNGFIPGLDSTYHSLSNDYHGVCYPSLSKYRSRERDLQAGILQAQMLQSFEKNNFIENDKLLRNLMKEDADWKQKVVDIEKTFHEKEKEHIQTGERLATVKSGHGECIERLKTVSPSKEADARACWVTLSNLKRSRDEMIESAKSFDAMAPGERNVWQECNSWKNDYIVKYGQALTSKDTCYRDAYSKVYEYGSCKSGIIGCLKELNSIKMQIDSLDTILNKQNATISNLNDELARCRRYTDNVSTTGVGTQVQVAANIAAKNAETRIDQAKSKCESQQKADAITAEIQGIQAQLAAEVRRTSTVQEVEPECPEVAVKCNLKILKDCPP